METIVSKGRRLGSVEIAGGGNISVDLIAAEDFSYSISDDEKPYIVCGHPDFRYAPVVKGQDAGFAYVCIDETVIGKIPLVYSNTVEQEETPKISFWDRLFGGKNQ